MAVSYLTKKGYEILHCNWRYSRYEIDIIAIKNELLRIIEVKSLKSSELKYPEESVTKKKFKGPELLQLPDGAKVNSFISEEPIALAQIMQLFFHDRLCNA